MKSPENLYSIEHEQSPKHRIVFTRHAERLPSGELSPEGLEHAKQKGQEFGEEAEVLKGYASNHPSRRAVDTAEIISDESGIKSPLTGEKYKTREIADFHYDVLNPDLKHFLMKGKDIVDETTLMESGLSIERDENGKLKIDIDKLPREEQIKIARLRQNNQKLAFDYLLEQPTVVHRLAICLAHNLLHEFNILSRYKNYREKVRKSAKQDVILNNVGHGVFAEALFKEAGVIIQDKEQQDGISFDTEQIGGYLNPLEAFSLEIDDPDDIPDLIPVKISRNNGSAVENIFLSREKLEVLDKDYEDWKNPKEQ